MKQQFNILLFLLCSSSCFAATPSELWLQANRSYQQKQYDSAISTYQQLLVVQPQNALVYYNLGNAFYKNNKVADAVLSYERALFYDPRLSNAKDNRLLAKSRIPNAIKEISEIFFIRWWQQLTASHTLTRWCILSLTLFLWFLTMILLRVLRKSTFPIQLYFIVPLFNSMVLVCAFTAAQRATHSKLAVVMANNATMTIMPNSYKGQSLIPEATTVETGEQRMNWIAITLPDNRVGWMQISDLGFVQNSKR
ncbi:MAG: tetratricopeptide repeat protein [Phycisphaerales bacterium]|nr:tetratricopeptide repeat protein [Phycisphaerales bacterium]